MKQFYYNSHNVCENPNTMTYKCLKKYTATINTAIVDNGQWSYSISFVGLNQGWSQPLIGHAQYNVFDTEQEAFDAGLKLLVDQITANNDLKKYDAILEMLRSDLFDKTNLQLSLFDGI